MNRHGRKLKRAFLAQLRKKGLNAGDVVLRWRSTTNPDAAYDPELEGSIGAGSIEEGTDTIRALIHYVNPGTTGFQRYSELEEGDVILDIDAGYDLSGKDDLRFTIGGTNYVQKKVGKSLARSWDVRFGDDAVARTILLRIQQ